MACALLVVLVDYRQVTNLRQKGPLMGWVTGVWVESELFWMRSWSSCWCVKVDEICWAKTGLESRGKNLVYIDVGSIVEGDGGKADCCIAAGCF
jgi:hypothetical protein